MRLHGDCPRDGNALLLSARKQVRRSLCVRFHTDECKRILHARTNLCGRHTEVFGAERDIVRDNCRNELIIGVLEHHADFLSDVPSPCLVLRIPSAHPTRSRARQEESVQMACEG